MKLLFKILSLRRSQEEGFVIPVVFALGLIMTLIGIISIFQSSDEEIISISQRDTSRALAAAESGVARYREYIDNYKTIAMYDACLDRDDYPDDEGYGKGDNWGTSTTCFDDSETPSWAKATANDNIFNLETHCPAEGKSVDDNDNDLEAIATRDWQNIGNDPSQGQYRLIDYVYLPGVSTDFDTTTKSYTKQPIGRLVVEGRVNQQNTDLQNEPGASVASISVDLPIQPGLPNAAISPNVSVAPFLNGFNPALWITGANDADGVTQLGNLRVNGNIILTNNNCKFGDGAILPTNANLFDNTKQSILIDPDSRAPVIATETAIENINEITLGNLTTKALPLKGAKETKIKEGTPEEDTVYYYKLVDAAPPTPGVKTDLELVGGNTIDIRSGRKVILYVDGDIKITPNLTIPPDPAIPGDPGVPGDININPDTGNNSANLEIYVTDPDKNIYISGDGNINIKALIHAPSSTVNITAGSTSNVTFIGAMWVKDWNSVAAADSSFDININNADTGIAEDQYLNYTYVKDLIDLNARVADPIIAPPSEWKTQQTVDSQ
jgi:hypothetical protein